MRLQNEKAVDVDEASLGRSCPVRSLQKRNGMPALRDGSRLDARIRRERPGFALERVLARRRDGRVRGYAAVRRPPRGDRMTWPVALYLAIGSLLALGLVGSIAALLGLKIHDAIAHLLRK